MGKLGSLVGWCVSALLIPAVASAATCTWTGLSGVDGNWSTAANWDNCGGAHAIPQNGDALVFPGGTARSTSTDDLLSLDVTTIQITGMPTGGNSYSIIASSNLVSVTISGGSLQVNTPGNTGVGPNFLVPLKLGAATVVSNIGVGIGTIGDIDTNGFDLTLTTSTEYLDVTGIISGAGAIIKNGPLFLFLEGNNTFTGPLTINAGQVKARHANALGTIAGNTTVKAGAALVLDAAVTVPEPVTLDGGVLQDDSVTATLSGPLTLTADSSVMTGNHGLLTVTGAISGAFTLTKLGTGGTILLGDSPLFTGLVVGQSGQL